MWLVTKLKYKNNFSRYEKDRNGRNGPFIMEIQNIKLKKMFSTHVKKSLNYQKTSEKS